MNIKIQIAAISFLLAGCLNSVPLVAAHQPSATGSYFSAHCVLSSAMPAIPAEKARLLPGNQELGPRDIFDIAPIIRRDDQSMFRVPKSALGDLRRGWQIG